MILIFFIFGCIGFIGTVYGFISQIIITRKEVKLNIKKKNDISTNIRISILFIISILFCTFFMLLPFKIANSTEKIYWNKEYLGDNTWNISVERDKVPGIKEILLTHPFTYKYIRENYENFHLELGSGLELINISSNNFTVKKISNDYPYFAVSIIDSIFIQKTKNFLLTDDLINKEEITIK